MADLKYQSQAPAGRRAQEIDEGLRSYMLGVYNYMALGVAATAIITLFVASSPALLQLASSLRWVFFIGILGMGFLAPRLIFSNSAAVAHGAFWGYCALWGVGIAPMVGHYMGVAPGMVVQAFGIAAATFGATSLFGYVTKRNLSGLATFFMIATIGIIIAMGVN
ncbi:MAG: Bax inhibitor-1/YccA family protein, partial [Anderseniella sp.]|nr:Bax inhibitor-1/YccA family protein [Anderseniella sp.]